MSKTYQEQCLEFVKDVITHGKNENVEKITLTWQQHAGSAGALNHAITVTYREKNT